MGSIISLQKSAVLTQRLGYFITLSALYTLVSPRAFSYAQAYYKFGHSSALFWIRHPMTRLLTLI